MAQQRPSTLKLLRFFLDLCHELDIRPSGVSSHEAAKALQPRYEAMWRQDPHAFARHFGELPEDAREFKEGDPFTFPSQATVLRYTDMIEEDLRAFFPGRQLIPRGGRGDRAVFQKPDGRDVQLVRHIGEGLFKQLEKLTGERQPLDLASSDAVLSFILPHLNLFVALGANFNLRTREFEPSEVTQALIAGDWDMAVGWENGYGPRPVGQSNQIRSWVLHNSECEVRLLVHPDYRSSAEPSRNLIAASKREYTQKHKGDDGFSYAVSPALLQGARLIYPVLPMVARIGEVFAKKQESNDPKHSTRGYQVDSFASVVNAVRKNNGVGLIPGWPWLCRDLERQYHLLTVGLTVPDDWGVNTRMALRAYTRASYLSEVTGAETRAATTLLGAMEGVLTTQHLCHVRATNWKLAGAANAEVAMFAKNEWHVWFVTPGTHKDTLAPRWRKGAVQFEAKPGKDKLLAGKLYLSNDQSTPFMDVVLNPLAIEDGFLMMRYRRDDKSGRATTTSAYLPARVTRQGYDGICFLGTLSFEVDGRPFSSPILFSDKPLEEADCRNIAHSNLLGMLRGDGPDV
jgi:DNA-binding transcriptional LysR family regulator